MSLSMLLVMQAALTSPGFAFDRVDIVSEEPGTWLSYDLPLLDVAPATTGVRFVEQVKPVFTLPVEHLYLGTSIASQSLVYEAPVLAREGLSWSAGLHTRLLLPRGIFAGVALRRWHLRLALGVSALSATAWAQPDWTYWSLLPTVGVGITRD
ncbi:MAG: hypothetical protein OXT09_19425 [Myxococcales bacterium]|nr:hypothetical protein [Myxococcales bacterium]